MFLKKCWSSLLVLSLILCCMSVPAVAFDDGPIPMDELNQEEIADTILTWDNQSGARVTRGLDMSVAAGRLSGSSDRFSLDVGDTVTFDCVYSPASANVNYGVIAPDGRFYSLNTSSGRLNKSIRVSQRGTYSLAVRNNSTSTISVSGFVNY